MNGGVDPALKELRFTFDRTMRDGAWSLVVGGVSFPRIAGDPAYDADRRAPPPARPVEDASGGSGSSRLRPGTSRLRAAAG